MFGRLILILILGLSLPGCALFHKKKPDPPKPKKPDKFSAHEVGEDLAFQSFLSQLRKAVANKDIPQLAAMMTPNFAYYMGKTAAEDRMGDGVFQFWEEKGLWPELQLVIKGKFISNDQYMVTPPQLVYDENYHGYRVGAIQDRGSWKFAYFVTDAPGR
jgi:hypothetical protein